jgi:hypothetical protein
MPGMVLPVTVDRADPQRVDIEWDEVESSKDRPRQTAEDLAAMMRGEGGAAVAGAPTVVNLSGRDLSTLSEEQKTKLRMLGIDPDALASEPGSGGAVSPPPADEDPTEERLARLERLSKLRDQGALTDEEFEAEKRRVLQE